MASIPEDIARDAREIARSGLIVGGWYAATYPDVASTGLKPSQHYAWLGGRLGRRPSGFFDPRFYAETNALDDGANPLLHYLRHGRERRRPINERAQMSEVMRLTRHLWGALPGPAGEALLAIADSPAHGPRPRAEALMRVAGRREFDGRPEEAMALLDRIEAVASNLAEEADALTRRGVLAARLGRIEEARACWERVPEVSGGAGAPEPEPGVALLLAGLETDGAARLAAIGAVLERRGFEPLALHDPAAPASFANLAAAFAPRALPPMGRVSVIVPAFRAARALPVAVRSLLAQSYPDLEILIIDDASPDDTFATAEALAREDRRVRPLRAERNGGAYAARNLGLAHATGDFVTTHDADDWSHPRKIEVQLRAFLRDPLMVANAVSWTRMREDLRCTTGWRLDGAVVHLSYPSLMLRREAARRLGPWDEVRAGADSEYLWRLQWVFGTRSFTHLCPDLPLAFALDEAGSLTRAKETHIVTNFHGLRLLYREAARHHLVTAADPTSREAREAHLRRVPAEMRGAARPAGPLDLCLAADLFDAGAVERMAALLADPEWARARVGILHEPSLGSHAQRFSDALWPLLDGERVSLLVAEPEPGAARRTIRVPPSETGRAADLAGAGDEGGSGDPARDEEADEPWAAEEDA